MSKSIKLSADLVVDATAHAKKQHRTPPKQIEHWARMGKIAEENPDLTMGFVNDIITAQIEVNLGEVSEYEFE